MPSSTSPNMVLFLPVPSVTAGPQWATETTSNWSTLDTHDHTAGKGVQIPIAALNVNADFSWLTFGQTNVGYLSLVDKLATGNLTVNSSFGNVAGLPYWRNSSGVVTALALAGAAITIPSGTSALGSLVFTAIAAPGTPSAGFGSLWYDSTATNVMVKNSAGVVKHGVQTKAAVSHQFITSIADDGSSVLAQPVYADISGNSGVTVGRAAVPLLINIVAMAGGTTASMTTISAGTYKEIRVIIRTTGGMTSGSPAFIRFNGDTGANYETISHYSAGVAPAANVPSNTFGQLALAGAAAGNLFIDVTILPLVVSGSARPFEARFYGSGTTPIAGISHGMWNNTASGLTDALVTFGTAATGSVEYWGVPA